MPPLLPPRPPPPPSSFNFASFPPLKSLMLWKGLVGYSPRVAKSRTQLSDFTYGLPNPEIINLIPDLWAHYVPGAKGLTISRR